ncbi:hypothetical protein K8R04_04845 [Candidatus Uhrbacteria bacterium]|nr:hypothetical protein [Candidatus Uhrbacteria bacterium]
MVDLKSPHRCKRYRTENIPLDTGRRTEKMTKLNAALLSITIICAAFAGCANAVLPDEHGRICEPGSMTPDSFGCLSGCDADASAYFCTADGRGMECRILAGRTCVTDPGCPGGGAECGAGVGACLRFGTTSCPAGSSVANICSAVAGTPGSEVCGDAIDNDCDGTVDDGCSTCVPSGAEICDNRDNDCDGTVDEGCDDDGDDHCDGTMQMGPSGSLACPRTPPSRSTGDDCDDTNPGRCPSAVEICGNGIDEDCSGSDLVCPPVCVAEVCNGRDDDCDGVIDDGVRNACGTCGSVPTEICGNGIDEDCSGSDLACTCTVRTEVCNDRDDDCDGSVDEGGVCGPTCGYGALVGSEICVEYGAVPTLTTVSGATVTSPTIVIFNCGGGSTSFAPGTSACVPLNESCFGWLAMTVTHGSSADERNYSTWLGYSGRSSESMGMRVFARTGTTTRELANRSWIAYDPSGSTYSSYAGPEHAGDRVYRDMMPVREDCATSTARPPDRY